jgi:subtilisin family serine protease
VIDVANAYYESDLTEWAEPNFLTEIRKVFLPNDPLLANQWHLENTGQGGGTVGEDVHAQEAWDITTGNSNIVIAIIDDGVDTGHPDLSANIQAGGYDFFDDDSDANPRYFASPYNVTNVNDIHGTPCAGVAAARGNNAAGVTGIAYNCRILPIKVWGSPNLAPNNDIADAIRYAGARAAVLSSSWTSGTSDVVRQAIQAVTTTDGRGGLGALALFAAGNSNGAVGFPANIAASIAVGASTNQGQRAGYSCFGSELDLVAPSNGGTQSIWTTDVSIANRGYNLGSAVAGGTDGRYTNSFGGTSSATPLAAGVAALIFSVRPEIPGSLARRILEESSDQIGPLAYVNGRNNQFGRGRVNAQRAVEMARAAPIGNARTKELHHPSCQWVRWMAPRNKRYFMTIQEGLAAGHNGCRFCMPQHDTG